MTTGFGAHATSNERQGSTHLQNPREHLTAELPTYGIAEHPPATCRSKNNNS